ncbi:MAG TPA: phosphonate ABC transporter, permease protein PhnE [Devosiaceae bacterium]
MTDAVLAPAASYEELYPEVFRQPFWKRFGPAAFVVGVVLYLIYAFVFFDVGAVMRAGHWERAGLFMSDWVSWNAGVEFRTSGGTVTPRYPKFSPLGNDPQPDWVILNADGTTTIEMTGKDGAVTMSATDAFVTRDGQTGHIRLGGDKPVLVGDAPAWLVPNDDGDFAADFGFTGQVIVENDRVKINKRFLGWPNFIFDTDSPFFGKSAGEVLSLVVSGPALVAGESNLQLALDNFWNNAEWQHGDIIVKLLQTLVMAFLGTLLGALVAFPLGFFAARNITPNRTLNWALKRLFDFLRSVDMLIWALFFTRAFGPGPLAGSGAVFLTEVGTLGKIYSESLENIDDKPREGVTSTGAAPILVQRYGVLPQVVPVMISQTLYQWESNTRGATIIGAVGAGGIGLKLWEAMRTNANWANVFYMVLLILLVVFIFDNVSNALRSRLINARN